MPKQLQISRLQQYIPQMANPLQNGRIIPTIGIHIRLPIILLEKHILMPQHNPIKHRIDISLSKLPRIHKHVFLFQTKLKGLVLRFGKVLRGDLEHTVTAVHVDDAGEDLTEALVEADLDVLVTPGDEDVRHQAAGHAGGKWAQLYGYF